MENASSFSFCIGGVKRRAIKKGFFLKLDKDYVGKSSNKKYLADHSFNVTNLREKKTSTLITGKNSCG